MIIPPTNVRDYLTARGWNLVREAMQDRLYVLQNPRYERRQLVIPMDITVPDYDEAVMLLAEKLAYIEGKPLEVILGRFLEVRDDTLRLGITSGREGIDTLPLAFATSAISAAQQLLLSAACTVLMPQVHHPRLSRADAQHFLEAAQFRHTEHSSFVLKISCAIDALDVQAPVAIGDEDMPFVRRTMLTLNRAVRQLVSAIEADRLPDFVNETKRADAPIVSSNLCEALTHFHDEVLRNSLEMSVSWAALSPVREEDARIGPLRIQRDYFPRIEEVRRALRDTAEHLEDTFIGTVEQLNGEMGNDGRRAGEVILALLQQEGEVVRARTNLTADQYERADSAHMNDGVFVRVTGRLHPGRQPRLLTNITQLGLVRPRQNQIEDQ